MPANDAPTCFISPSTATLNSATTSTTTTLKVLTIAGLTGTVRTQSVPVMAGFFSTGYGIVVVCSLLWGMHKQKKRLVSLVGMLLIASLGLTLSSCGGGGGSSRINFGTPPGAYAVTITASSGNSTQSASISLNVQ